MKSVHRYSIIIFSCSMVAAIAALLFAGLIYFRTMSELDTMTTTSREALVLFAENVEGVNESLASMKDALQTQRKVAGQNETLINELVGLRDVISRSNETLMVGMETTSTSISESNATLASSISSAIAGELSGQTSRMVKQLESMTAANNTALDKMAKSVSDTKNIDRLITNQQDIVKLLGQLSVQNNEIQQLFQQRDNRVSYP